MVRFCVFIAIFYLETIFIYIPNLYTRYICGLQSDQKFPLENYFCNILLYLEIILVLNGTK